MRRAAIGLGLAVTLLGCGLPPAPDRVELLTGIESCYAGGQQPSYAGVLVAHPVYGTQINGRPVMWTVGYTGRRLANGDIEVLNRSGEIVATTGKAYAIAPVPWQRQDVQRLLDGLNAIGAPDCYPWDFEEVPPGS